MFGVDPLAKWYVVYHASFYYVFTALPFGLLIYLGTGPDTKKFIAKPVYVTTKHPQNHMSLPFPPLRVLISAYSWDIAGASRRS